ncbi:hypothetical protein ABK040_008990 [Willaertia magna]
MSQEITESTLEKNKDNLRIKLQTGEYAILNFDLIKKHHKTIHEFYHIEVPPSYRGKGIAMPFAKKCFDYAKENGWTVKVTCPYLLEKFLGLYRNKYEDILFEEEDISD